jgi:hypothetical protein
VQESDLPESVKLELANLLGDPQFVEQLIAVSCYLFKLYIAAHIKI